MFCFDPFKNAFISVTPAGVGISPCCLISTRPVTSIDYHHNEYLNSFRETWLSGEVPKACNCCLDNESKLGSSRRVSSVEWYANNNLDNTEIDLCSLDFWVGNVCNLRCAICGPNWSSAWQAEVGIQNSEMRLTNQAWQQLDLGKLRSVHFNGGEPLLSKEHVRFLEAIPDKNAVTVSYNTNGTVRPSAELLELWSKFQLIQLAFSIDDIEERFEYQRYPAKWSKVTENLKWFIGHVPENCMFRVEATISVLNANRIDVIKDWLSKHFSQNRCGDPVNFSTHMANGVLAVSNMSARTFHYLDTLDSGRGLNWRETFPELLEKYKGC